MRRIILLVSLIIFFSDRIREIIPYFSENPERLFLNRLKNIYNTINKFNAKVYKREIKQNKPPDKKEKVKKIKETRIKKR